MSDRIPLTWDRPPLSLNDRGHWRVRAKHTAQVREQARWSIRSARPAPRATAAVTLVWRVPDNRRRDLDNLSATLKPTIDALVDEGVLPDDDWRHVTRATCRIEPPDKELGVAMWLELA